MSNRPVERLSGADWVMVTVGFGALGLAFSARAALGLAMPAMEAELHWSRAFLSGGGAIALVVMATVAPFAGNAVDRRGPRALLAVGLIAIGAGLAIVAASSAAALYLVGFGFVAALGFGGVASHVVATAVSGSVTAARRGLAVGIATSGSTAGQLVIVPLLALLLATAGWRLLFAGLAAATLLAGIGALLLTRGTVEKRVAVAAVPFRSRTRLLLTSPTFHALFWSFALCGFTTTGVVETHLLPYAASCGLAPLPSAAAFGILSATNLLGMVLAGHLSDRMNRPLLLAAIYLLRALSFLLLFAVAGDLPLLFLFAILFGLFDYSTVPVTASLVASHLGLDIMGLAMGLISAGHALGGAAGAYLGGVLFDLFAQYWWMWMTALWLAALAAILALTIAEQPRVALATAG